MAVVTAVTGGIVICVGNVMAGLTPQQQALIIGVGGAVPAHPADWRTEMTHPTSFSLPRLIVGIAAFVLVGFPLVGYLWETLNQLMGGEIHRGRLALSLVLLVAFAGVLVALSRTVRRWEAERIDHTHPPTAS